MVVAACHDHAPVEFQILSCDVSEESEGRTEDSSEQLWLLLLSHYIFYYLFIFISRCLPQVNDRWNKKRKQISKTGRKLRHNAWNAWLPGSCDWTPSLRPRRIGRIGRIGQVVLAHFSALRSIVADWKERSSRALVGSDDGSLSLWRLDSSECLARRGREKSRKITKNATLSKSVLPQDDSVRTCQETWKVAENLMLQLIGSLDTWALFGPSMLTGQQAQIWQNNRYIHNVVSDVILNYWCDVDVIWCDVKRRSAWLGILQYSTYHSLSENISTHIAKIPMCQTNPGPWKHETALNPDVFTVTSVTS